MDGGDDDVDVHRMVIVLMVLIMIVWINDDKG